MIKFLSLLEKLILVSENEFKFKHVLFLHGMHILDSLWSSEYKKVVFLY